VMSLSLDTVTLDLIITQDALEEKKAVLERRLSDIYKRGSLWAFQVLLTAESFGELLNRYKYLYLVGRQDLALAADVEELRDRITERRNELIMVNSTMQRRRTDRGQELSEYRRLQNRQQRALATAQQNQRNTERQLDTIDETESQLQAELARLTDAMRAAEASGAIPLVASITSEDLGRLPWPMQGSITHSFGPTRLPNGTEIDQKGIGISSPEGTPVTAVKGGRVEVAMPYGTYGPSVWIRHGGGFFTLYLYLSRIDVREGETVEQGEQLGVSGGGRSEWGPHIEFQIRGDGGMALDPTNWLRPRR
jgi:murein DD-endopeptidase MepM/ murein hydrolase activator NlpD